MISWTDVDLLLLPGDKLFLFAIYHTQSLLWIQFSFCIYGMCFVSFHEFTCCARDSEGKEVDLCQKLARSVLRRSSWYQGTSLDLPISSGRAAGNFWGEPNFWYVEELLISHTHSLHISTSLTICNSWLAYIKAVGGQQNTTNSWAPATSFSQRWENIQTKMPQKTRVFSSLLFAVKTEY